MEELMEAIGAEIKERGYTVKIRRDSQKLPLTLEISNTNTHTLILAEIEDQPGHLEVCSEREDLHHFRTIDLNNPNSIDEIIKIVDRHFMDEHTKITNQQLF